MAQCKRWSGPPIRALRLVRHIRFFVGSIGNAALSVRCSSLRLRGP
jgi:hypothetical protein